MKILLYGKNAESLKEKVQSLGFEVVAENPELVISYGGDGTLLASEHKYPGISKLPMRDSAVCVKCPAHEEDVLLNKLKNGELVEKEVSKLEAKIFDEAMVALNDIVIRNTNPIHAIRFEVYLNGQKTPDELVIGDGIVASTPFGSTGYFHSITRQSFYEGFQIAFNNTVKVFEPLKFSENDSITLKIVRGPAQISFDNSHELIDLEAEDKITLKAAPQKTKILEPETLRCPDCKTSREKRLDS